MDLFVLCLFLFLRFLCDAQIPAPTTRPTGCAGPPVLCCPGQNSSCFRGCYCDQICLTFGDCCRDYGSTCTESVTQVPTRTKATGNNNIVYTDTNITTPTLNAASELNVSTASASTVPISTATSQTSSDTSTLAIKKISSIVSTATAGTTATLADIETTSVSDSTPTSQKSSTTASTPLDGLITSVSTAAGSGNTAGISNKNTDSTTGTSSDKDFQTVTFHLKAVLSFSNRDSKDVIAALSSFLSNILLQLNCEHCVLKVQHVNPT